MPVSVRSFPYTPDASFSEEFPVHFASFSEEFQFLTLLMPVSVRSFPDTPDASFSEEFP